MQPPGAAPQKLALPNIKYLVAVASGKGGVGKSTVSANLALALHTQGRSVGIMDADIYGPSIPTMLGVTNVDPSSGEFPIQRHGIKIMSMGFVLGGDKAAILRGPMVQRYLVAFLTQIDWGQLDYLLLDMPPGTGDAQLALAQTAPVTGALVVTTPQDVSLSVARRGVQMFRQVNVPVLGVVENMSYFVGDDGKRYDLFCHGGGQKLAAEAQVPFLGDLPIDAKVSECGDAGEPVVTKYPQSPIAKAYLALATAVDETLKKMQPAKELPGLAL
jgi:ATP-binding protein involved in chromosome partitioning